ncbi:hypothetical protein ANN_17981 [Periplaneta americana]|uniref:Uncharacterized protein n=1 Tax=Periplaneta americana TaxID=6978 RepID=A0ABQ8SNY1_PERAM|nr:hypothetical protein ANN_17981 [Periplaneta americana]
MAGLCEGGNEPSGSLKAICVPPIRKHHCSNMKAQVSIILGYAIERQLAKRHEGWKSNIVAEDYIKVNDICFSEKSILSRLRTSHNLRDIAQGQFRFPFCLIECYSFVFSLYVPIHISSGVEK